MNGSQQSPLVVLKRFPTMGELLFLRRYMATYKMEHPDASAHDLKIAAQKKFDSKKINKPIKKLNQRAVTAP